MPPGAAANAAEQLRGPHPQLLRHDRGVGLDVDREALEADHAAGPRRGRDTLLDDRLERGDRPCQAELVLETQGAGGIGDAARRSGASAGAAVRSRRIRVTPGTSGRDGGARRGGRSSAPSSAARTSQPWAISRSAGSRSSGVVVVTNACGSSAIRRTRCDATLGVELAEHVVEEQQRRTAVELGQEVELGELEGEDRRALLATRREAGEVPAGQLERQVVAMRPDQRRAVPDLLLGGLGQPPRQRVARRLAGERRGVRHVAQRQAAGRRLVRGDLAVRGRSGAARVSSRRSRAATTRPPVSRNVRPRTAARRGSPAPPGSRAAGCCAAGASGRTSPGRRRRPGSVAAARASMRGAAQRRRADDEEHLLGREQDDPQERPRAGGAPADAVDADPLAPAGSVGTGSLTMRDLERRPPPTRPSTRARSRPSGSAPRRRSSGATGPSRAARSPRAGSSCRRRSGPRSGGRRARRRHRARRIRAGRGHRSSESRRRADC